MFNSWWWWRRKRSVKDFQWNERRGKKTFIGKWVHYYHNIHKSLSFIKLFSPTSCPAFPSFSSSSVPSDMTALNAHSITPVCLPRSLTPHRPKQMHTIMLPWTFAYYYYHYYLFTTLYCPNSIVMVTTTRTASCVRLWRMQQQMSEGINGDIFKSSSSSSSSSLTATCRHDILSP